MRSASRSARLTRRCSMSRVLHLLCASMFMVITGACAEAADIRPTVTTGAAAASPMKVAETKALLRDLWLGHILSIRNVAVATMDKNAAAREAAESTVVTNAEQIARSIERSTASPRRTNCSRCWPGTIPPSATTWMPSPPETRTIKTWPSQSSPPMRPTFRVFSAAQILTCRSTG